MRLLLLALACCACVSAFSQDLPVFEKKPYKDASGTLYWPLSLPVYFQLTPTPNASADNSITLSEPDKPVEPMYWDGHGKHHIKHDDSHPGGASSVLFTVYADGIAPVATVDLSDATRYAHANELYFGKGLSLSVQAKDEMSGLEGTYVSVNQAAYARHTAPVALPDEKAYQVQYFAVDKVGNAGEPKTATFVVDLTAPTSTYALVGNHLADSVLSPKSFIALEATDAAAGVKRIEYYFDDKAPARYTTKISLASLADGEHTLTYYAQDQVGNQEAPQHYTFYLDSQGPEVTSSFDVDFAVSEGRYYASTGTLVTLVATDNKAGVKQLFYSINGGKEQTYTEPFALPAKQGRYNIRYRAIDQLDNIGATFTNNQISALFIDDTPPVVSHSVSTPKIVTRDTLFVTDKTLFTLKGYDAESGSAIVDYNLDEGKAITFEEPFSVPAEGKHDISYSGTDLVNNSAVKTLIFVVDNSAPEIFMHTSLDQIGTQKLIEKDGEIPIYAAGTSFYMAATDQAVGTKAIYYKLNQLPEVLYTRPVKITTKGAHVLTIRAVDYLGNEQTMEPVEFAVQ